MHLKQQYERLRGWERKHAVVFVNLVYSADVGTGDQPHLISGTEVSSGLSQPLLVREDDLEGQAMRKRSALSSYDFWRPHSGMQIPLLHLNFP